ncbi:MAG: DUF2304 domain-containing protein [Terriglobia bacterium]
MNAETLMLLGGIFVFFLTIYWVRGRDLSEKHAILWTGLAFVLLICGLFPSLIMTFAMRSHLSYPAAVLFVALGAIYVYSFSVSVSLTQQQRKNIRLTQELAILENRVERLEEFSLRFQKQDVVRVMDQAGRAGDLPSTPA